MDTHLTGLSISAFEDLYLWHIATEHERTWKQNERNECKMEGNECNMKGTWEEMNAQWKAMKGHESWKAGFQLRWGGPFVSWGSDNVVYICRSLRLTPFSLQHNRRAADPGLRCVYLRNYRTTFAPEEPRRSQVQNPVFSSRSSDI